MRQNKSLCLMTAAKDVPALFPPLSHSLLLPQALPTHSTGPQGNPMGTGAWWEVLGLRAVVGRT